MILSKQLLFVHVPKTGGTSVRQFLLETLPRPVLHVNQVKSHALPPGVADTVALVGHKHLDLLAARPLVQLFTGQDIPQLPAVVAGVRNPYDREISLYRYWSRHRPRVLKTFGRFWPDFEAFTRRQSTLDRNLGNFYQVDGAALPNLRFIRTESIEADLTTVMRTLGIEPRIPVPVLNVAPNTVDGSVFTQQAEAAVFARYRLVFELGLYPRMTV